MRGSLSLGLGFGFGGGKGTVFDSGLWPGTSLTFGLGWVDNGDGTYTRTAQVSSSNLELNGASIPSGDFYDIKFTLINRTAGEVREILGGAVTQGFISVDASYSYRNIENTGGANSFLFQADAAFAGTIKLVSLINVS